MGHDSFVMCEDCGYEREFMLGVGMMYGGLDSIVHFLDKKSFDEVSKVLENNPNPQYETDGHCVYQCRQCFSIREKLHLIIYDNGGKTVFQTSSNCSKCNLKRKRVPEKNEILKDMVCPRCKKNKLNVSEGMLWD